MNDSKKSEISKKNKSNIHTGTPCIPAEEKLSVEEILVKYDEALKTIRDLKEDINELRSELALFKKAAYGQKSEKTEVIINGGVQLNMFNEAEEESTEDLTREVKVAEHTRKAKKTHKESFKNLPVEEVVHEAEEKTCPKCGTDMETVGKEFVRDEVVYVPARLFLRRHFAEVLKCPECGNNESEDKLHPDVPSPVFVKASVPSPVIAGSFCSPELLSHIIYEKYVQSVPLYRQEKDFRAKGLDLSRSTMANWVIYAAKVYGQPVIDKMKAELLQGKVIHADETVVQVLHEENRKAKTQSRMWVYTSPASSDHSNVLFQYSPTRSGENAVKFLGDYSGYVVCDGYDGYNKLTKVTRCGCLAHLRRKFVEALPIDKDLMQTSKAARGVEWCNKVFEIEKDIEGLSREEKYKQRQERTKPVLDGFFTWLQTVQPSGGTKLARAVQYALNERKYLYQFLNDPDIAPDNNRAENAIRPFVIGRKNWEFSDTVKGAQSSAVLYSLAVTACSNGLDVEKYFTELFTQGKPIMPWNS